LVAEFCAGSEGSLYVLVGSKRLIVALGALLGVIVLAPTAPASADSRLDAAKRALTRLNNQADRLDNQIDLSQQNIQVAEAQIRALRPSINAEQRTYHQLHQRAAQLATSAYEQGGPGSTERLLSAKDPQTLLSQMSTLAQLSNDQSSQLSALINAAQRLEWENAQASQAVSALNAAKSRLGGERQQERTDIAAQTRLIDQIGSAALVPGTLDKSACELFAIGRVAPVINFACDQLGKPYVFGGAGPDTWDCSGLTMMAWKQAGVNLAHFVPDQWSATQHPIARADIEPGDLLYFDDFDHEGLYIGDGMMLEAPHTGDHVKIVKLSTYPDTYIGASRP
jgi:cell wall-associated NlpC family hydrolase